MVFPKSQHLWPTECYACNARRGSFGGMLALPFRDPCYASLPAILSPSIVVESLQVQNGVIKVVRDDLLPGGTKQRAIIPYLEELITQGYQDFVYASPFCGYAQVALASAAAQLGVRATIFCEKDQTPGVELGLHPFAKRAEALGALVICTSSLAMASERAGRYARAQVRALELPLGFDCDRFRHFLGQEVGSQLAGLLKVGEARPKSIWLPIGSGTLASVFDLVISPNIRLNCVNVRIFELESSRLAKFAGHPRIQLFNAPERFEQQADLPPAIPSNAHYDAKLWQFINRHAEEGDIWWNVGP